MSENKNSSERNTRSSKYHKNKKEKHLGWLVLKLILLFVVVIIVSGVGLFAYYAKDAPSISKAQLQSGGTSSLYTTDGKFLLSLGSEKRIYVDDKHIPQKLKDAVISVEDKRFYSEGFGLDPVRIVGSVLVNARAKGVAAGGSTITQQLVKLSVFSTAMSQRTLKRKAQEAWLSMKVEREFSKKQILEFYINKVYMNYGNYGMGTAADFYYGKPLKDLNLAQTALIAGMPNAPISYDPYVYPKKAKYRRDIVLYSMLKSKKISSAQYNAAVKVPITEGLLSKKDKVNSNLRKVDDPYIKEVINEVKEKGFNPYNDNLKITININQHIQQKLYDLANNGEVPFTNDKMQIGATIIDPNNGHVVAILGGRKLPAVQLGLNRAVQTARSTGSTIKPVLDYAPAIEYLKWSTSHIINDSKYIYPGTKIQLYDWDNVYQGKMSIRRALEQSRNVPAVKTLKKVGLARASLFVRKMGINIPSDSGLSVGIGANASTLQMASAYAAFANNGRYYKPQFVSKIETPDGITRNYDSSSTKVMKESTAYMITDMLKGVLTRGLGTMAKCDNIYEAGKTGTVKYSDEDLVKFPSYAHTPKDSWFIGYTKAYSIGIWTGYDNLKDGTISGIGENSAQLFYKKMMTYLMKNKANSNWKKPSTVVRCRIVNGTERKVAPKHSKNYTWQLFVKGHAPAPDDNDEDVDNIDDSDDKVNTADEDADKDNDVKDDDNQTDGNKGDGDQGKNSSSSSNSDKNNSNATDSSSTTTDTHSDSTSTSSSVNH